jgi:hypothetical protein
MIVSGSRTSSRFLKATKFTLNLLTLSINNAAVLRRHSEIFRTALSMLRLKNELEIFVGRSKNDFPDVWRQSQICERVVKQHFSQLRDPNISSGHWEIACSFKMILTLFFHLFCLQEDKGHWEEHGLEVHLPGKTSVDKCCQELYWAAAF